MKQINTIIHGIENAISPVQVVYKTPRRKVQEFDYTTPQRDILDEYYKACNRVAELERELLFHDRLDKLKQIAERIKNV